MKGPFTYTETTDNEGMFIVSDSIGTWIGTHAFEIAEELVTRLDESEVYRSVAMVLGEGGKVHCTVNGKFNRTFKLVEKDK